MAPKFFVLVRNSNGYKRILKKCFFIGISGIDFTYVLQIPMVEKKIVKQIFVYIDWLQSGCFCLHKRIKSWIQVERGGQVVIGHQDRPSNSSSWCFSNPNQFLFSFFFFFDTKLWFLSKEVKPSLIPSTGRGLAIFSTPGSPHTSPMAHVTFHTAL